MMKKIMNVIIVFALVAGGCATINRPDDKWFARDKALHFGASAIIAGGSTYAMIDNGRDENDSTVAGFGIALVFGIGKETYDAGVKKTYWSWKDFIWDIIGAGTGAFVVSAVK